MSEILANEIRISPSQSQQRTQQPMPQLRSSVPRITYDEYFKREKRKNSGLIEKCYNWVKNLTGLGYGSNKVNAVIEKAKAGRADSNAVKNAVHKYNSSQETSAQLLGDAASIGASAGTFFALKRFFNLAHAKLVLNEEAEKLAQKVIENRKNKTTKIVENLINTVKSKNKLLAISAVTAAFVGGYAKMFVSCINRIGSKEFNTDKKDFNGAKNGYDKKLYKREKKRKRTEKIKTNLRNFASGAINGLLMPLTTVGGAIIGVPLYFAGNSLNRYFVGSKTDKQKSLSGYIDNLSGDIVTTGVATAAIAVPLVKKTNFTKVFDTNLKKSVEKLKGVKLEDSKFFGKSTYDELDEILMNSENIKKIIDDKSIKTEEKIVKLTEENMFAVKFKQIAKGKNELTIALRENCPATRTLEQAQSYIDKTLGSGYKLSKCLGVGTVAETYLAKSPDNKEVCLKVLKEGINKEKIEKDKQKFIDIINKMSTKSDEEKKYLLRNIDDLADGILKEVDFANEMKAAEKLVKYTKVANVVKPIEVKNGVYVMEKAGGISLDSLVKLNQLQFELDMLTKVKEKESNSKFTKTIEAQISKIKDKIAKIEARTPEYGEIKLSDKDASYMLDEYMKVIVEQFNKVDKNGKVLHADIHPGNIFIDINALRERKGKIFTLIDTGNTVEQSMEQSLRSLNLTSYIRQANVPDLTEYVLEGAILPKGMTKNEAAEKISEELKKCFFDDKTALKTVDNNSIITLTSNIMKKYNIIPNNSQLNLNKAIKSSNNSLSELIEMLFTNKFKDIDPEAMGALQGTKILGQALATGAMKYKKFNNLKAQQEKLNLLQMSLEQQLKQKNNPNNLAKNSENYITYELKQAIKDIPKT